MASIRDHAVLESVPARLEELIAACRRGGALYTHSPNLANDVTRKAKALRTSIAGLRESLEKAPEPEEKETPRRKPLALRLYSQPLLYEMVRFVGREGRGEIEFWDFYRNLADKYTVERASAAMNELFDIDKATLPAIIRIKPKVLPLCNPLLGGERDR